MFHADLRWKNYGTYDDIVINTCAGGKWMEPFTVGRRPVYVGQESVIVIALSNNVYTVTYFII